MIERWPGPSPQGGEPGPEMSADEFTRMITSEMTETENPHDEGDEWLSKISRRLGVGLRFRLFRFSAYQSVVMLCDERGSAVVCEDMHSTMDLMHYTVMPVQMGFFDGNPHDGVLANIVLETASSKLLLIRSQLTRRFHVGYTISKARNPFFENGDPMMDYAYVLRKGGKMFKPLPESESIQGMLFKMDVERT